MPEPVDTATPVIVAGGGWAGLAAAVTLCRHGIPVRLLEAARQLGGRARSVRIAETVYDNGQHLMIGAYEATLALMETIGVDTDEAFERLPLTLHLYRGNKISLHMHAPTLPAPLHLAGALVSLRGFSLVERLRALQFSRAVVRQAIGAGEDISVLALLHSAAQTPGLVRKLWEPLCVAMLNTRPERASAKLFIEVLRILFTGARRHADLLIPGGTRCTASLVPASDYLETHGARIDLGQRVTDLEFADDGVRAVQTGSQRVPCRALILATPAIISHGCCQGTRR